MSNTFRDIFNENSIFFKIYPPFMEVLRVFLSKAKEKGLEVDIFQGYRSFEEQQSLYNKGRTEPGDKVTNAKPGQSWHNYGLAVDIVFKPSGKWSWAEEHDWNKLGEVGKELGLEWGGDWKSFQDRPHFQWPNLFSLTEAKRIYDSQGLNGVWTEVSNGEMVA